MTHISNWRDLIRVEGEYKEYMMVPLNGYQMGNLIDAIAQVRDTGDWYGEFCDIVAAAMRAGDIKELGSNHGRTFTLEQIEAREIRSDEQTQRGS